MSFRWLFIPLLLNTVATAALASTALPPCASTASTSDDRTAIIAYDPINALLTQPDYHARLQQLPTLIQQLAQQSTEEAQALVNHLRLALARAHIAKNDFSAAIQSLRDYPLHGIQAAEALFLLAELHTIQQQTPTAQRLFLHIAELFPESPWAVSALLRTAEISPKKEDAITVLHQARELAKQRLSIAQQWQQQSQHPDFLNALANGQLPKDLWHLAQQSLVQAPFTQAEKQQQQTRQLLHCLTEKNQQRLQQQSPQFLADLLLSTSTLEQQLALARTDLASQTTHFQETATASKACTTRNAHCTTLKQQYIAQGRSLTGWRNRINVLEKKLAYLQQEQRQWQTRNQKLQQAQHQLALQLMQQNSTARQLMQQLLQEHLSSAVAEWETLLAQTHFQLAEAENPLLR